MYSCKRHFVVHVRTYRHSEDETRGMMYMSCLDLVRYISSLHTHKTSQDASQHIFSVARMQAITHTHTHTHTSPRKVSHFIVYRATCVCNWSTRHNRLKLLSRQHTQNHVHVVLQVSIM